MKRYMVNPIPGPCPTRRSFVGRNSGKTNRSTKMLGHAKNGLPGTKFSSISRLYLGCWYYNVHCPQRRRHNGLRQRRKRPLWSATSVTINPVAATGANGFLLHGKIRPRKACNYPNLRSFGWVSYDKVGGLFSGKLGIRSEARASDLRSYPGLWWKRIKLYLYEGTKVSSLRGPAQLADLQGALCVPHH